MKQLAFAFFVLGAACAINSKDAHREAANLFVSGKAFLCGEGTEGALGFGKPAAGKTIRLATTSRVLAEDVVGPDGSFVLHPKVAYDISDPVYIVAGDHRITLANNYASWIQDHLSYHGDVRFGCGDDSGIAAPASAARSDEIAPSHVPPPQLIPGQ